MAVARYTKQRKTKSTLRGWHKPRFTEQKVIKRGAGQPSTPAGDDRDTGNLDTSRLAGPGIGG